MKFLDIANIIFVCTAANHLGLVTGVEKIIKREIPIANCIRCLTFWAVLAYGCWETAMRDLPEVLAISFLSAWAAIWLDLMMGMIDKLYTRIYDALYTTADTADTDTLGATDTVPDVPGQTEGSDGTAANQEDNH